MSTDWSIFESALQRCPVIPVLTVGNAADGEPLLGALVDAGMTVIEVTLRTADALAALAAMVAAAPENVLVGGGTAIEADDLGRIRDAGGRFAVSPGASADLLEAGAASDIPYVPGVATVSEALTARALGFRFLKFFPAEALGGAAALKSMGAPLPDLVFCPTGGITSERVTQYLRLTNVAAVGGSWMVPEELLAVRRYDAIADLARETVATARGSR